MWTVQHENKKCVKGQIIWLIQSHSGQIITIENFWSYLKWKRMVAALDGSKDIFPLAVLFTLHNEETKETRFVYSQLSMHSCSAALSFIVNLWQSKINVETDFCQAHHVCLNKFHCIVKC